MARLADGDRSAFAPVFETLWPLLAGFARKITRDASEAEDAAQQALLKVFEYAHRYDAAQDAAAWALAITANECHAARRKRRGEALDSAHEGLPSPDVDPETAAIDRDLTAAATEALGSLRTEDAATLAAAWNGVQPPIPPTAFRKRVQRATERLRAAWRSRHGTS